MREIKFIVVHCTATPQTATVASIQRYWRNVLKWKSPGYHIIVHPDGRLTRLQSDDKPTNGVGGHNANALHVSYIGGVDAANKPLDNRTMNQKQSLLAVITYWKRLFPNANIQGHKDFPGVTKACPSFDAKHEYRHL
jgi:N-acetylmuramoyl-L-alanine amidase